ncbi:MAG: hypothetical protein ACLUIQ_04580 [Dialister invisus]
MQEEIYAAALELKKRIYMNEGAPDRGDGIQPGAAAGNGGSFSTVREKQAKAAAVMDAIQEKFGSMLCGKASGWRKKKERDGRKGKRKQGSARRRVRAPS